MANNIWQQIGKAMYDGLFPMHFLWDAQKQGLTNIWKGLSGETTAKAIAEANERNIQMQKYWNEVQMEREDTAHQREVADLHAAGLNPWLGVSGTGAAAGTLNSAQVEPVDGSKLMQATSAMAMLALTKLLLKK